MSPTAAPRSLPAGAATTGADSVAGSGDEPSDAATTRTLMSRFIYSPYSRIARVRKERGMDKATAETLLAAVRAHVLRQLEAPRCSEGDTTGDDGLTPRQFGNPASSSRRPAE